jgi:hypothetical protein
MAMPRSEHPRQPPPRAWLADAGEVAQWTAQLLAWLWLGEQGQRLGWPLASGVWAVAVWWAVRVLCRGTAWAFRSPSALLGALGLVTALGVTLSGQASAGPWGQGLLLALAAVWGGWSALVETRSQTSSFGPRRWPWPPVLAAVLLGLGWMGLSWMGEGPVTTMTTDLASDGMAGPLAGRLAPAASLALALCAGVLFARDRQPTGRARACSGAGSAPHQLLAPSAMGLMMGTLWLGPDWCMGAGWTTGQAVATHVALMAGLPALVALVLKGARRVRPGLHFAPTAQEFLGLALIALGALMWLGNSTAHGLLAMLLPSVAWALHCNRTRVVFRPLAKNSDPVQRGLALCLGPVLLLAVGVASAEQGPLAMQWALSLLGALASVSLFNKRFDFFSAKLKFEAPG